jgi:hypothetical protein
VESVKPRPEQEAARGNHVAALEWRSGRSASASVLTSEGLCL